MNNVMQHITLELTREISKSTLSVKKNDTNIRKVQVVLTNNGGMLPLENVVMAVVKAKKPDGKNVWNDCVIQGNVISFTMTSQMINVAGDVTCEIEVTWIDQSMLTTPQFTIHVYDSINTGVESQNEYNGIVQALAETIENRELAESAMISALNSKASAESAADAAERSKNEVQSIKEEVEIDVRDLNKIKDDVEELKDETIQYKEAAKEQADKATDEAIKSEESKILAEASELSAENSKNAAHTSELAAQQSAAEALANKDAAETSAYNSARSAETATAQAERAAEAYRQASTLLDRVGYPV